MTLDDLTSRLDGVRGSKAICPAHDDREPSLSIGEGEDGRILLHCHAGCSLDDICAALDIRPRDLMPEASGNGHAAPSNPWLNPDYIAETYPYHAADGSLAYEKLRSHDKNFLLRHYPDGGERWKGGVGPSGPLLYRLPEVIEARERGKAIILVEGEKDVDNLRALGLYSTTSPYGGGKTASKKWPASFTETLCDARVFVIPDNDEPGRAFAWHVAKQLSNAVVVELPGVPVKGDVSDWIAAGGTRPELELLCREAMVNPPTPPEPEPTDIPGGTTLTPLATTGAPLAVRELDDDHPTTLADDYLSTHHSERLLKRWRNDFYEYVGTHYRKIDAEELASRLWAHAERCRYDFGAKRLKVTNRLISDATSALMRGDVRINSETSAPCWLADHERPASEFIAVRNGLLHIPTRVLYEHTSDFFNTTCLPFNYDPSARAESWYEFLTSLFGEDTEPDALLAEWFGYCLTPDMTHHKLLAIVGPPRSGKGTIARVLQALVGTANSCSPTLSGLATQFGLQGIIGKRLAVIADARISGRADSAVITERLLSLTGGDSQSIPRKHQPDWHGFPETKFVLLANDLPRLPDASTAFAGRLLLATTTKSFLDAEDHDLEPRLLAELPGILNWALDGLDRLNERRRFTRPESAEEALQDLRDASSPIAAFIRDCCVVRPDLTVSRAQLYEQWKKWASEHGHHAGSLEHFGRALRAAQPGITTVQRRVDSGRERVYSGIGTGWHTTGTGKSEVVNRWYEKN